MKPRRQHLLRRLASPRQRRMLLLRRPPVVLHQPGRPGRTLLPRELCGAARGQRRGPPMRPTTKDCVNASVGNLRIPAMSNTHSGRSRTAVPSHRDHSERSDAGICQLSRVLSAALSDFPAARRVSLVPSFSEREGTNQCAAIHEILRSVTRGYSLQGGFAHVGLADVVGQVRDLADGQGQAAQPLPLIVRDHSQHGADFCPKLPASSSSAIKPEEVSNVR